jgi:carbon monoxide dehydrogenase subunit G
MARFSGTVNTAKSPDEVWNYLADLRSIREWDPSVEDARLVEGEPGTVGARYELDVRFMGRIITLPYETKAAEPPHRVTFEAENGGMSIVDEAVVVPALPGAMVTWTGALELRGARRALDPILQLAFGRLGKRAEDGLRERLNATDRSATPVGVSE